MPKGDDSATAADESADAPQRRVGMATCRAVDFDASSNLPYRVTGALVLVLDRRDIENGQVFGCLQAEDVAIACDVKLPWVMLAKGSYVRHAKARKGRIKLESDGWLVTNVPNAKLLVPQHVEEVKALFSQNAFKKPPMVKIVAAPEETGAVNDKRPPVQEQVQAVRSPPLPGPPVVPPAAGQDSLPGKPPPQQQALNWQQHQQQQQKQPPPQPKPQQQQPKQQQQLQQPKQPQQQPLPKQQLPKQPPHLQPPPGAKLVAGQIPRAKSMSSSAPVPVAPPPSQNKGQEVLFWGICDIKYDPSLPKEHSVRVLELGDGRASRFSGHGSYIKDYFDNGYYLSDNPLKRSIMVDNKKITHDMFVRAGYTHLRPPTAVFPRRYTPDLALKLADALQLKSSSDAAVLKLVNRSRGAGVVVVTAETADAVLKRLLCPPTGQKMTEWLERRSRGVLKTAWGFEDPLEEPSIHWWSNECPVFVAERCCHSKLVRMDKSPELFDGTLRVAFALRHPTDSAVSPFDVVWLGGYWKLPRNGSGGQEGSAPEELHSRIVSSFNSADKRTAPIGQGDLQAVYEVLTPALPRIFQNGGLQPEVVERMYKDEPLFHAFGLARVACAIRLSDMPKARKLLESARQLLPPPIEYSNDELPQRSCLSYVERNCGVCYAIEGRWEEAGSSWRKAVRLCAPNATAHYLVGCYQQVTGQLVQGAKHMQQSIALDPDFRSSYIGLSNCYLLDEEYALALEACEACLQRFPEAVGAQFNKGQALYQLLLVERNLLSDVPARIEAALECYDFAKSQSPEFWMEQDTRAVEWLHMERQGHPRAIPRQAVHIWRVFGWRP